MSAVNEAVRAPLADATTLSGTVRIGVTHTVAGYFLPRHHARFQRTYPRLKLELFTTSSVEAVRSMVAAGMGVTILSDMVYRPWSLEGQRIDTRNVVADIPTMDVGLAFDRGRPLSPASKIFHDFLSMSFNGAGSALTSQGGEAFSRPLWARFLQRLWRSASLIWDDARPKVCCRCAHPRCFFLAPSSASASPRSASRRDSSWGRRHVLPPPTMPTGN
jgi:hypothetical protein